MAETECMLQSLLASKSPAVEVAELQKLVLKIFWSATYMGIPALLLQEPQFVGWMTSLLQAVKQPVPQVRVAHYVSMIVAIM